ncbi:hypothetical protein B0J17DRAFT_146612 [Rhizoctonia solani]|nr:hypothetical protein B0J17DRAFT_146612 [Rhizoctonia solani]
MRDDNQPYEPEDRQWTPRDAPLPLPRARSPVAQMEVDPPIVPLPEKQLAGWANFHRRREQPQERREPYRSRPGVRDSWHPAPNEDQDMEVEGSKRQRIEDGARPTQSFNHREEDLPRKLPQYSPTQRPKIHSPNNSFSKLPPPALVVQPVVDVQAALNRAKDVASQLAQANPQHKPRPRSRFDQPPDPTRDGEINQGLLVPDGSSGAFGAVNASETVLSETNERSSPEVANDARQGSEGSHSSHIVSRMDEASLRDNGYPQRQPERHRDSRPDNGPPRRDRNRSENHRNGGRNNGEKSSRFIDSYRPGDENPGRGAGGMRAWGKSETEPQRDPPPHTPALSTNRVYRNAGDRAFARPPRVVTAPEGLPPRPPTPTEFVHGARSHGPTAGQVRSPPGQGARSYTTMTDTDAADAATDNETDHISAPGFSFRQASASSPRKSSLLDRMTDPTSGAPLTVPPKDRSNNGNGHQQRRLRLNRTGSRR